MAKSPGPLDWRNENSGRKGGGTKDGGKKQPGGAPVSKPTMKPGGKGK